MNAPNVIRSNADGIDSALELIDTVDRNLRNDAKNADLPEATRMAATAARGYLGGARDQLGRARGSVDRMRPAPKKTPPKAIHEPERARVIR